MASQNAKIPRAGDTRVVLFDPSRTPRVIVSDYYQFKASPRIYEQGTFEITVPIDSQVCTETYSGRTALVDRWLGWSFDFYFRGQKMFSGPVTQWEIAHKGWKGTAYATLHCVTFFVWFLGGRVIETADKAPWAYTGQRWDKMWRDLVRSQVQAGSITKPAEYPGTVTRSNFGPWTVTVPTATDIASTGDYTIQAGKGLLDTAIEMCFTANSDTTHLHPVITETSAANWQITLQVGKSGGSRQIGADNTGTILISGYRSTMSAFKLEGDNAMLASVWRVAGSGRSTSQGLSYKTNSSLYSKIGCREDSITVPAAGTASWREQEAQRLINESTEDATRRIELELEEQDGLLFGVNYNIKDSVTAEDKITGEQFQKMIVGADIEMTAPGPVHVKLLFGRMPRNASRELQRSGGGLRGGGRSGGRAERDSDGQDGGGGGGKAYFTLIGDTGTADAEGADHYLQFAGYHTATVVRISTNVADGADSSSSGSPDQVQSAVFGTPLSNTVAETMHMRIYGDDGKIYAFNVRDMGAGGDPPPPQNT